jgi:hypothetical protein
MEEQRHAKPKAARPAQTQEKRTIKDRSAGARVAPGNAAYAFESPAADGRRSRKSTRSSANRSKPDTNFNLRESLVKGSPEARFRKARAKNTRVRGSKH